MPTLPSIPSGSPRPLRIACALVLVAIALPGLAVADPVPRQSRICLDCHSGRDSTLVSTGHELPAGVPDSTGARVACTDCHRGDARHWEGEPQQYRMSNPASLSPVAEAEVCLPCHPSAHPQSMRQRNVHTRNDVSCSGCHSVHQAVQEPLLKASEQTLCTGCHRNVAGQFARSYRHPVADQTLKCSDCHQGLGETARTLERTASETCTRCHAEFDGPFPYEHPAALAFATDEGGCMSCHDPHGSELPRMLNQPYAAPHFQLCTQCHAVPRHNSNAMHGTQWSGVACNECHTDIHGSYVSRLFLSESLQAQGCFNAGCHQF